MLRRNLIAILIAFLDLALTYCVSVLTILFLAMLLIKPDESNEHPGELISRDTAVLTHEWNSELNIDLDTHIRNVETGQIISYQQRNTKWGTLERDDLGVDSDTMIRDGIEYKYKINREVIHLRNLAPGLYNINIHFYGGADYKNSDNYSNLKINLEFTQIEPGYKIIYKQDLSRLVLKPKEEVTILSFTVNDEGNIIIDDIDTITQYSFVNDSFAPDPRGP